VLDANLLQKRNIKTMINNLIPTILAWTPNLETTKRMIFIYCTRKPTTRIYVKTHFVLYGTSIAPIANIPFFDQYIAIELILRNVKKRRIASFHLINSLEEVLTQVIHRQTVLLIENAG
jgi:hypothetical protein